MGSTVPYRASTHAPDAFVPPLGWTRPGALALAVLGAAPSARVVYDLLTDHDCDKQSTPHFGLAALVVLLALGFGVASVKAQRRVARAIARRARVRSAFAGVAFASLALLPAVPLELANVSIASAVDFSATFRFCFDGDVTRALFPAYC